ncbi:MAG: hypothetical protein ABIT08_02935 [Bacteroidia bacterium]
MKNSPVIKSSLTVSLFVSALFLASCEKENFIKAPSAIDANANTSKQISGVQVEEAVSVSGLSKKFTLIRIDRISAGNNASDYSITVSGDAWVTFTARDDGSGMGAKKWKLPDSRFAELKKYLETATSKFQLDKDVKQVCYANPKGAKVTICYSPAGDAAQVRFICAAFKIAHGLIIDNTVNIERIIDVPPHILMDTDVNAIAGTE